jgi:hypothetical protein
MAFENRYSLWERWLHRLAFATRTAQLGIADLEQRLFRRELAPIEAGAPVLITALPRAGTTILLEMLAAAPSFASHTYRDMPFVLCPLLWQRFTQRFQADAALRERAHGDGIQIGIDSPEAFEEILWMAFFADHYRAETLPVWQECHRAGFADFFAEHQRKVILLRRRNKTTARRYVSKNNLDLARIPTLWQAVPQAQVVVLVRDPLQQAKSLHQQHLRFLELHQRDAFARRYMAGIGHFDFGANLKPVDFGGWHGKRHCQDPRQLGFWLEYWLAAYQHVLQHADRRQLHIVSFERLCAGGDLSRLAHCLGIDAAELASQRSRLGKPRQHAIPAAEIAQHSLEAARAVHAALLQRSVV